MYLRTYLKVDQRYLSDDEKITLTSTASLYSPSSGAGGGNTHPGDGDVAEQSQEFILEQLSDQWIEIELTEAATKLWSQIQHSSEVNITITATVDCAGRTDSPVSIVNPAEIPLENTDLREGAFTSSQPLLLVLATDDAMKRASSVVTNKTKPTSRGKRQSEDTCDKHDFIINFHESGFTNVSVPISLNIGKCAGSCSENALRQNTSLGTNHAKMMSTIQNIQLYDEDSPVTFSGPATSAHCVPDSYEPQTALFMTDDTAASLHVHYFNDMVVTSCRCQ